MSPSSDNLPAVGASTGYYILHRCAYANNDVPFDDAMHLAMTLGADIDALIPAAIPYQMRPGKCRKYQELVGRSYRGSPPRHKVRQGTIRALTNKRRLPFAVKNYGY